MDRGYVVHPWCKQFEELYDKQLDHFWRKPSPDKFSKDRSDWEKMKPDIKQRIKYVVHILNRMEPEIVDNVDDISMLLRKVLPRSIIEQMDPIFGMIASQTTMEFEHRRSYALIDSILGSEKKEVPFLDEKVRVISKWRATSDNDYTNFSEKDREKLSIAILGTVFSEGLVFNTLFSFFLYLQKLGLIPTTCITNEEVRVDENLHTQFYIALYFSLTSMKGADGNTLIPRLPQGKVHEMLMDFVRVEDMATETVLGNMSEEEKDFFLIMNVDNSKLYTRIVANSILDALGYDTIFKCDKDDNPYTFVNQSLIHTLASFFDRDSVDYGLDVDHAYEDESDLDD